MLKDDKSVTLANGYELKSKSIIKLPALLLALTFTACLAKRDYGDNLKVAIVTREDLSIDLFYLQGEANPEGIVVWERCLEVSDSYQCIPLPNAKKQEIPFPTFRQRLGESMIKDITVTEFSRAYGSVLGAIMAQGDPVTCSRSSDLVLCQHQSFKNYQKEYKWLQAAFGVKTNGPSASPAQSPANPPKQSAHTAVTNSKDLGTSLEAGKTHVLTMNSTAMQDPAWSFGIYLPVSYKEAGKRFPVLYSLHGGNGNHLSNRFEVDYIIRSHPDTIVVFPSGGRDTFYLDNGVIRQQRQNPDTHIIRELLPYIDDNFRTIKLRTHRALTGFSMGGYGVFHFGFKYPEQFGGIAAMAGGGPYGPNGLIRDYSAQEDPRRLIGTNSAKIKDQMQIIIAVGRQDLFDYNREFSEILNENGIKHSFLPLDGVGHDHGKILNELSTVIYDTVLPKSTESQTKPAPTTPPSDSPLAQRSFCKKYNWDGLVCSEVDIYVSHESKCKWGQRWWCAEGCAKWGGGCW